MPEHTDPIQRLESFGVGGIHVDPLTPDQVRRLGDKRRARRRASIAIAASALAVVGAVLPVTLAMTDDARTPTPPAGDPTPGPDPTPTPSPTPLATATPEPPRTITYPGDDDVAGVRIYGAEDLPKLRGTSDDFQAYVLEVLRTMQDESDCPVSDPRDAGERQRLVIVSRYSTAGYAVGSTGGCDGHAALWTEDDGTWGEAIGTQEIWSCSALEDAGVPVSFVGGCYGENGSTEIGGDFGPTSVDGIELGMTATQVESVGASVVRGPSTCDFLFQAWTEPPLAGTDIADTDGFVVDGKVVAIRGFSSHRTPEGIGNGSARLEVESAYPSGRYEAHPAVGGYWVVPLADGNQYRFYMSSQPGAPSDSVVLMEFSRPGSGCGY